MLRLRLLILLPSSVFVYFALIVGAKLMENYIFVCLFILQSDVNTVCFADESGHLIYSGSDDALCKVNIPKCFVYFEFPLPHKKKMLVAPSVAASSGNHGFG